LPLPGTAGGGRGAFLVQAQLPDVANIGQNSRVRVGDVTVGNVTAVERQGWHALVTMSLDADVKLPSNATATVGQTSLLGTPHIELAAPTGAPAQGSLHNGSLIPLSSGGSYPTTEHTLGAVSLLLNGGGIGQIQDITRELRTAFTDRDQDLRDLIGQLDQFVTRLNEQSQDIIEATASLNRLAGQFASEKPVLDNALRVLPKALMVLKDQRDNLAEALNQLGRLSAVTAETVDKTKGAIVAELSDLGPVLESVANAGPAMTRSLDLLATFPWPKDGITNWFRGDYANVTMIVDLTLSRLDAGLLTGTRFEGMLTKLEMQWGRTIGQQPSPYTAGNPLTIPYRQDQGS
jgi:phospholipid/cholesterol/gamma-HCH transport system substrate-binding protein